MANNIPEVSDLEPVSTDVNVVERNGMVEVSLAEDDDAPTTTKSRSRSRTRTQLPKVTLIEVDPDNLPKPQGTTHEESGNSTFSDASTEPQQAGRVMSTASVSPPPVINNIVNNTVGQAPSLLPEQRLINTDFVQKTKAINAVPRDVIEKRLDEIDAMFSLRRNTAGASRDNATIMLAMALWEIMGL